jgi:drug/metabolite transporter (DMT)-like permease
MKTLSLLFFAFIGALGNSMFAASQKKAIALGNSLAFLVISIFVSFILALIVAPLSGPTKYMTIIKQSWIWVVVGGIGLFLTFLGFNLLYTNFGTSSYMLYAVMSIITTSIIVSVVIFKETFNVYHWAAFVGAIVTIILYTIGNSIGES